MSVFLLSGEGIFAQKLKISPETFDFGVVKSWENQPAVFQVKNRSFEPQYLIVPKVAENIITEVPINAIESDETVEIRIFYYATRTGPFQETILLYESGGSTPIKVTIKGNIKSIANSALMDCPGFSAKKKNEKSTSRRVEMQGIVIDKVTRKPISFSLISILQGEKFYTDEHGEFRFRLLSGAYPFYVQAEGYVPHLKTYVVKQDMGRIVIELEREREQEVDIIEEEKDTVSPPPQIEPPPEVKYQPVPGESADFSFVNYKANNIVLLVDISFSMSRGGKIQMLKKSMENLVTKLRSVDYASLISFANQTTEHFISWKGTEKKRMVEIIRSLVAKGTTNGVLGLENAFRLAETNFIPDGNNQVIIATDGGFTGTNSTEETIRALIEKFREKGIVFSVVGFGHHSSALSSMRKMAEIGGGKFLHFNSDSMSEDILFEEIKANSLRQ